MLLDDVHSASHLGARRTLALLTKRVWWPTIARDVKAAVATCEVCQKNKDRTTRTPGPLQPLEIPQHHFATWTIDFVGDLPMSQGYNSFLTCVEKLSKYLVLIPCTMGDNQLSATAVADLFYTHIVSRFGVPSSVVSDRDPRFTGEFWRQLWARMGTKLRFSTSHHPQTDG